MASLSAHNHIITGIFAKENGGGFLGLPAGDDRFGREPLFERFENLVSVFDVEAGLSCGGALSGYQRRHGIAEAHGGALEVESQVGVGTTFTYEVPIRGRGAAGDG